MRFQVPNPKRRYVTLLLSLIVALLCVAAPSGVGAVTSVATPTSSTQPTQLSPSPALNGYFINGKTLDPNAQTNLFEYYSLATVANGSHGKVTGTHTEVYSLRKGAVVFAVARDVSGDIDYSAGTLALAETNFRAAYTSGSSPHITGSDSRWNGKLSSDGFVMSGITQATNEPLTISFHQATSDEVNAALTSFGVPKIASSQPSATPSTNASGVPAGNVTTVLDTKLLPKGTNVLHGITRDASTGDLYVGVWDSKYNAISGMYTNDDSVRRITTSGAVSRVANFPYPQAMMINPRDGMLYVATGALGVFGHATPEKTSSAVHTVDLHTGGNQLFVGGNTGFVEGGRFDARFSVLTGVTINPDDGTIYVSDSSNQRIRRITADATVSTLAGAGTAGNVDGAGATAKFNHPRGIVYCKKDKSLYVADSANNEIRKITLDGVVTTIAGAPDQGYADGPASSARFSHPSGVACDPTGNLYVADPGNNSIREITPSGVVSTLAGGNGAGTVDGVGIAARFAEPADLWYEPTDASLYVIDWGSTNIRKVTTVGRS